MKEATEEKNRAGSGSLGTVRGVGLRDGHSRRGPVLVAPCTDAATSTSWSSTIVTREFDSNVRAIYTCSRTVVRGS